MFLFSRPKHAYRFLLSNDDLSPEEKDDCPSSMSEGRLSRISRNFWNLLPWFICAVLTVILFVVSTAHRTSHGRGTGSYETGFDTELGMLRAQSLPWNSN